MIRRTAGWLALGMALSGCTLIDQRTFGAKAEAPGIDQLSLALKDPGMIPLVVIRLDGTEGLYNDVLANAVDSAEQRKPDVAFDLVSVIPGSGTRQQQDAALTQAQQDAISIMDRMTDAGANPEAIHMAAKIDPAATGQEVRIYVH